MFMNESWLDDRRTLIQQRNLQRWLVVGRRCTQNFLPTYQPRTPHQLKWNRAHGRCRQPMQYNGVVRPRGANNRSCLYGHLVDSIPLPHVIHLVVHDPKCTLKALKRITYVRLLLSLMRGRVTWMSQPSDGHSRSLLRNCRPLAGHPESENIFTVVVTTPAYAASGRWYCSWSLPMQSVIQLQYIHTRNAECTRNPCGGKYHENWIFRVILVYTTYAISTAYHSAIGVCT